VLFSHTHTPSLSLPYAPLPLQYEPSSFLAAISIITVQSIGGAGARRWAAAFATAALTGPGDRPLLGVRRFVLCRRPKAIDEEKGARDSG
jgi:hypothetical protein